MDVFIARMLRNLDIPKELTFSRCEASYNKLSVSTEYCIDINDYILIKHTLVLMWTCEPPILSGITLVCQG